MSAVNNPGVFTVITSKANFAQNAANTGHLLLMGQTNH